MTINERISRQPEERKKYPIIESLLGYHQTPQKKLHKPDESETKYSNYWKKEMTSQE